AQLTRLNVDLRDKILAQVDTVRGTVMEEGGNPLPGVTVRVMGTNTGTITDENGRFVLTRVDDDAILVISYVGYHSQEVTLQGRTRLSITLVPDLAMLEEVVVVGYGTQRKSDLTGSVASVSGKTFENVPVSRVDQMLQG